jgi:hypothetical protein
MAALLSHQQLSCYARFGMGRTRPVTMPSAPLPKLKGRLWWACNPSACADGRWTPDKLMNDTDPEVAGRHRRWGVEAKRQATASGIEEHKASGVSRGGPSLPALRRGADGRQPCPGAGALHRAERDVDARAGAPDRASRPECRGAGARGSEEVAGADGRGSRSRQERVSGARARTDGRQAGGLPRR